MIAGVTPHIALDVLPNEARVWRAAGHDPATAAPVLAGMPPDATRIPPGDYRWSMVGGPPRTPGEPIDINDPEVRAAMHHPADDPPGTRGSYAGDRRRFGHNRP